jgi:hypothetical protein
MSKNGRKNLIMLRGNGVISDDLICLKPAGIQDDNLQDL